ncbi:MAG: type II toxin-antitoxin system VapC family toxin [Sulfuritalea sp.]|nr:type II toxin-antitoxin system VapC family toxin [Sulfuritalea sp.]
MIALDTNILVRFLLRDDEAAYKLAVRVFSDKTEIYTAAPTVMLELAWVLESNDCDRKAISKALRMLMGLPNFQPMEGDALLRAVNWYEEGLDFADAPHLSLSAKSQARFFLTADEKLAKRGNKIGAFPRVHILRAEVP